MMRICFVCEGNIIRSPLAKNMIQHMLKEKGLSDTYHLDSAGTSAYHVGEKPDSRMRQVAQERGYEYTGRARQFQRGEMDQFDLIIAMDQTNYRILQGWAKTTSDASKIRLMREFDPESRGDLDVPDPYYGGMEGFKTTFDVVKRSCEGLLLELEGES
jgi:protein-tyrosine phosphatase